MVAQLWLLLFAASSSEGLSLVDASARVARVIERSAGEEVAAALAPSFSSEQNSLSSQRITAEGGAKLVRDAFARRRCCVVDGGDPATLGAVALSALDLCDFDDPTSKSRESRSACETAAVDEGKDALLTVAIGASVFDGRSWTEIEGVVLVPGHALEVVSDGEIEAPAFRPKRVVAVIRAHGAWRGLCLTSIGGALRGQSSIEECGEAESKYVIPVRTLESANKYYSLFCRNATVLSLDPLLVQLDGFASKEECRRVRHRADQIESWKRSVVYKDADQQLVSATRTSSTAWFDRDAETDLTFRASMIAELGSGHAESWQLAKYAVGEEFTIHLDTQDSFNRLMPGGRISTLFLYLNDVEEGGRTIFPHLDIAISPKEGTALFFRNVRAPVVDGYDMSTDARLAHLAEPVLNGEKLIMTKWFHPWPYPNGPSS